MVFKRSDNDWERRHQKDFLERVRNTGRNEVTQAVYRQ